ncbi:MAG: GNAT family N-acetyltransferase [Candidatus Marinimicrobia bacterium]|nr:GNAT family N-acetyltransferase [Candidatus Neomarinimicrobiota bacterium]
MNSTIQLTKMDNQEFDKFKTRTINSYANEIVENIGISEEKALAKSKEETDSILKDGINTDNHIFLSISKKNNLENIGHIWIQLYKDRKEAFIYHIEIIKKYRGQGLGGKAIELLENYLKQEGISRLRLNVFQKNVVARSLYENNGFHITNVQMQKDL